MQKHRVTLEELADELKVKASHLGAVRRGEYRPDDYLKVRLAIVTLEIERDRGVGAESRRGVPILDWFEGVELERLRRANAS